MTEVTEEFQCYEESQTKFPDFENSGLPGWVWSIGVLFGTGFVIDLVNKVGKNIEVSPRMAAIELIAALAAYTLAASAKP